MHQQTTTKIFFSDLDGTLLNDQKKITPATVSALKSWTNAGHKFAICTGRAIDSAKEIKRTQGLDLPGVYLIGCNGGEIYDCEKDAVISRIPLSPAQCALILKVAKEHQIHCHTYTDTHIISPADNEELRYYQRAIHTPAIICEDIISALDKPPCKFLAIELYDKTKLDNFRHALQSLPDHDLQLLYSNDRYLELFPAASGKGVAVKILCDYLNIPLSNALAAGDAGNDISMLQTAGIGIAMLNAGDDVKTIADIITETDHNQDGLVPVLLRNM